MRDAMHILRVCSAPRRDVRQIRQGWQQETNRVIQTVLQGMEDISSQLSAPACGAKFVPKYYPGLTCPARRCQFSECASASRRPGLNGPSQSGSFDQTGSGKMGLVASAVARVSEIGGQPALNGFTLQSLAGGVLVHLVTGNLPHTEVHRGGMGEVVPADRGRRVHRVTLR